MRTSMVSSYNAAMGLRVASFLVSLHTPLTTLNGTFAYSVTDRVETDQCHSVSLTCIRSMARCLCPTCYTRKDDAPDMGSSHDMKFCEQHARQDDQAVRDAIEVARHLIFFGGRAVGGKLVDIILKQKSLQPLRVRSCLVVDAFACTDFSRTERFFLEARTLRFQHIRPFQTGSPPRIRTRRMEGDLNTPAPYSICAGRRSHPGI